MKTVLIAVCCVLALAVCGCAWIEAQLTPEVQAQVVAQVRGVLQVAESYAVKYEAERLYWRAQIDAAAPGDPNIAVWLAREAKAWEKAQYYRDRATTVQAELTQYEEDVAAAEGPGDVVAAIANLGRRAMAGTPYALYGEFAAWLLTVGWGVYQLTKKKQITAAAQAVITSVQPLVDRASPEEVERIAEIQGLAGERLVDAAQGKVV